MIDQTVAKRLVALQEENDRLRWECGEGQEMLRWAYSKLHAVSFTKQDDALMQDRINLFLQHGVLA